MVYLIGICICVYLIEIVTIIYLIYDLIEYNKKEDKENGRL